jgi:uncharacterized repeat protein (TIGR02543 family)
MTNETASGPTNLTTNAFTRTGYTFAGWNTPANGTGTSYAPTAIETPESNYTTIAAIFAAVPR